MRVPLAISLAGALPLCGCSRPAPPRVEQVPDFDLLATVLSQLSGGETGATEAKTGQRLLWLERLRAATFAAVGDIYKHYDYAEPAELPLNHLGWSGYASFLWHSQNAEFAAVMRPVDADEAARLEPLLDVDVASAKLGASTRRFVALLTERHPAPKAPPERKTVWLLETGHGSEAARAASVRDFEARFPGRAQFVRVDLRREPELARWVGSRLTSACVLDGLLLKDVVQLEQWIELLVARAEVPVPPPRYPALPIFDGHEHVMGGGEENLFSILRIGSVRKVVVAALPNDEAYTGIQAANERALALAKQHPDTVVPFVILSPRMERPLELLKRYVAAGARGVKLMTGHGQYYRANPIDLDTPGMREVFRYCEATSLPVLWHVNLGQYDRGFLRVLEAFPKLKVVNPHLGGYLSFAPEAVRRLFTRYPNLSFDISFGTKPIYLRRALEDLSYKHEAWRKLFLDFPDRFLFGIDMVIDKDTAGSHAAMLYRLYRAVLEEERYDLDFFSAQGFSRPWAESHHHAGLKGLSLPESILKKVYWENARRLYGSP